MVSNQYNQYHLKHVQTLALINLSSEVDTWYNFNDLGRYLPKETVRSFIESKIATFDADI